MIRLSKAAGSYRKLIGATSGTVFMIFNGSDSVGHVHIEPPIGTSANLHVFILPNKRRVSVMKAVQAYFKGEFKDTLKGMGITTVCATCRHDDSKTLRLLKFFGFSPEGLWYGSMTI